MKKNCIEVSDITLKDYQFYPTPKEVANELIDGINNLNDIKKVLEPSAGKGDLADAIKERIKNRKYQTYDIGREIVPDCIELDEHLRLILKGKKYNVIGDDFLKYNTNYCYDLIIMNPPFKNGDKHLLKAIDMMEITGGEIACILNKETLYNPYSNTRILLKNKLDKYSANIREYEQAFSNADRKTDVEIVLINISIPRKKSDNDIFEELRRQDKYKKEYEEFSETRLALGDYICSLISDYNLQIEAGIKFLEYYYNFNNKFTDNSSCIQIKIGSNDVSIYDDINKSINNYIELIRCKFWKILFNSNELHSALTSKKSCELNSEIDKFVNYEFDYYNIKALQISLMNTLVESVNDSIDNLFNKFSQEHSYDDFSKNTHLFNGWKTNKSWKINKKVIIPLNSTANWLDNDMKLSYESRNTFRDMFVVLGYLDNKRIDTQEINRIIDEIENNNTRKKVKFPYVTCDFYKKGTCHITFDNKEVLDMLNRIGARNRNWLPPSYGKKEYSEMDHEEKSIIDEFDGEKKYTEDKLKGKLNFSSGKVLMLGE